MCSRQISSSQFGNSGLIVALSAAAAIRSRALNRRFHRFPIFT
jgi:hypothetical protein